MLGRFDGRTFTPEGERQAVWHGRFYAAQTYSNAPDGRRVQVGWASGIAFPGMPFNQQMTLPVELTLRRAGERLRLHAVPVRELAALRETTKRHADVVVRPGANPLPELSAELLELEAEIEPGKAATIGFRLGGHALTWEAAKGQLSCGGVTAPLPLQGGRLRLHVFVDRGSIEVFGNDGAMALSVAALGAGKRGVEPFATGAPATLRRLTVHALRSSWR